MRPSVAALVSLVVLLVVAGPAAARFGMPEPLTDRGKTVEEIYTQIAIAGILVFVLVFALLVWVLVRYRESTGAGRATHEKHRGSLKAELVWTVLPLIIMLWIGVMSYGGIVKLDKGLETESFPDAMEIKVTGVQWSWIMDYGEGVTAIVAATPDAKGHLSYSDTFHLPADQPILLNLTGGDVIHAFNIIDANRAYVTMDDANPDGPHKYHRQVVSFPAGKYLIQCKEMCLNPGHGYMRAELIVEPKAAFDRWYEERLLCVGSERCDKVAVTTTDGQLSTDADLTVVKGGRILVEATNSGSNPVTLTAPGSTTNAVAIKPGTTGLLAFDLPTLGTQTLTSSNGGSLAFTVIDAEVVNIDLASYVIRPDVATFQAGHTYLVRVTAQDSVHNYYIGEWDGNPNSAKTILAKSPDVKGGAAGAFVFTPTATGTYDAWCDISGHFGAGMHATATVA